MDNPQWFPDPQRDSQRRNPNGQPSRDYPSPLSISAAGHASASAVPPVAAAASSSSSSRAASAYSYDQFQHQHHHHQHPQQQHLPLHSQPQGQSTHPLQLPSQLPHPLQPGAHHSSGSLHAVASPLARDTSGDIAMHDAHDAHAGIKYPMRPHHQSHLSGTRSSGLYSPQDQQQQQQQQQHPPQLQHHHSQSQSQSSQPSSAAQRYSPMDTLSPTSPYASSKPQFTSSPSQQTPPNAGDYSQSPYYVGRGQGPPQLPPIASYTTTLDGYPSSAVAALDGAFSDSKAPRRQNPPVMRAVPEFKKIKSPNELQPKNTRQPRFRRANPEGGFISPLQALTAHLPATYRICNPSFKYESSRNPRRVLTKPSKGTKNDGYDNEDSDYILYVNDILGSEEAGHKNRYLILDVLGQGTFGQVVKCQNLKTQEVVAVKVIKNRTAYFNQSMMEVSVLDLLNTKLDKNDDHHLLRLKDTFIHRQHLCLVFELLSVNLYELIKQNQFRGLSTTLVRVFAQQLLNGLALLNKARLIHCDLKPENILLKNLESPIIKIIDFGSACDERQTVYTYIQSRFYRSPEVLLGLPYSSAIDMWSLGCIVVELFLGLPLFPGSSEYNQIARIVEMLGNPPNWMIDMGKQGLEFFERRQDEFGRRTYHMKSMEQYSREHNTKEQPSKKYFQANTLPEIIKSYPMPRKNMKQSEIDREMNNRIAFIDFVRGLLNINPLERWSPQQAKLHPFITQQKYTGPFVPPMNLKSSSLNRSPAPGTQQQQQAEALSKQRAAQAQAQAAQAQAQAQAAAQAQAQAAQSQVNSAQGGYGSPMGGGQYQQSAHVPAPLYSNSGLYNPGAAHGNVPPQYGPPQTAQYGQMGMQQAAQQMPSSQYPNSAQPNMYQQGGMRTNRQRASTMEQQQSGIPPALQRVASHLDPSQPIRLQPSPAYYPPTGEGLDNAAARAGRRGSRVQQGGQRSNRDFIRNLEERTLEEGFMGNQNPWH
ncbi:dual specificity protein kinase YAK1 [Trichoderma asperellum]|nr:kinase domain-containing protein [Trichoderma asperelloides]